MYEDIWGHYAMTTLEAIKQNEQPQQVCLSGKVGKWSEPYQDYQDRKLLISAGHRGKNIENVVLNLSFVPHHGAVNLVDDNQRPHLWVLQSLLQHKLGLCLGTFNDVHQQHYTIHHRKDSLHFATEISVARSIYNIEDIAVPICKTKTGLLGKFLTRPWNQKSFSTCFN